MTPIELEFTPAAPEKTDPRATPPARSYAERGVPETDLVLMITTRPAVGSTMAWAVACERDQNGRPTAGQVRRP